MPWKGCQARDTLGFECLRFSLVFDIPNPVFIQAGGLTRMKCRCAISLRLNFSLLWLCECHVNSTRDKLSLVSGEMLLQACAGQNNSDNNLFLTPHSRENQCCFNISADLTESWCCVVGRIWGGCSEKTVSNQNLLRMGDTWSRCLVPYWAACSWQGQHDVVCRSSWQMKMTTST